MSCAIVDDQVCPIAASDAATVLLSSSPCSSPSCDHHNDDDDTNTAKLQTKSMLVGAAQWASHPLSAATQGQSHIDQLLLSSTALESVPNSNSSNRTSLFDTPVSSRTSSRGAADRYLNTPELGCERVGSGDGNGSGSEVVVGEGSGGKGLGSSRVPGASESVIDENRGEAREGEEEERRAPLKLQISRVRSTTWQATTIPSTPTYTVEHTKFGVTSISKGPNDDTSPKEIFSIARERIQQRSHEANPYRITEIALKSHNTVAQKFRIARRSTVEASARRPSNAPLIYSVYHTKISGYLPSATTLLGRTYIPHLKLVVTSTDIFIKETSQENEEEKEEDEEKKANSQQQSSTPPSASDLVHLNIADFTLSLNTDAITSLFSAAYAVDALVACVWVIAFYDSGLKRKLKQMPHPLIEDENPIPTTTRVLVPPNSQLTETLRALESLGVPRKPKEGEENQRGPSPLRTVSPSSALSSQEASRSTSETALHDGDDHDDNDDEGNGEQDRAVSRDSSETARHRLSPQQRPRKRDFLKRLFKRSRRQQAVSAKRVVDGGCTSPRQRGTVKRAIKRATKWLVKSSS